MSWDFSTEPEFQKKLDWARDFMRAEVMPLETLELDWPTLLRVIEPLKKQVKEQELWAAHLDPDLGGQGYGQVKMGLLQEILGASPLGTLVFGCQAPDSGNAEILAAVGTPEQKRKWLEPLLSGQMYSSFALTEPDNAGADPTNLTTTAVRDGDEWILNGDKWFISNAATADFIIVVAVTDPDADRHRRASQFIVPIDAPGLTVVRDIASVENPKPRPHSYGSHCEVTLRDVRLGSDAMLGGRGDGFVVAQIRLGPGRIHHCMRWIGQATRAFDMMCERATYRSAHGSLLADKQTIRNFIADSAAEIQALRLMTLHAAWRIDNEGTREARKDIALIKFFGARMLHEVIDRSLQVHGSLGYSSDLPLESMYRAARAARLYDGPDEVHRDTVARQYLKAYAPPPGNVPTEHIPSRRTQALERFADLLADQP
ncbi:MAG: acyl-CoA dehydrogenase family protein [Gordonia sp.]|jgi:acyl-CoA dehydrogenase|uniref:acyl-CoA dehydrogenase family protein n=1 Tax=Gordonia sp. (in: high G+C Gram-positive bacteria) TaxID=84139 RepID=UPI001DB01222|nr:acyl-CoA dehydrogenase family protein [Gordonia sp. (in: high G+C Gram-positive bacteria)]MCB1293272.1 acyl-CoA dehydrogenase family protein [Gordonia sp. (in: high G+C Gram-positive bacteria)]HQV17238.1 acyl-CoA dehydrogenase family protein [Gordonia sp. (in: high G+C Gram-positive bacteria)]